MPTSIPKAATLPTLGVGDKMNHKGQEYIITAVGAPSDDGNGKITYAVTLNDLASTVVSCSANNTVINNPGTEASGTGVETYSRVGQA